MHIDCIGFTRLESSVLVRWGGAGDHVSAEGGFVLVVTHFTADAALHASSLRDFHWQQHWLAFPSMIERVGTWADPSGASRLDL